MPGDHAWHERLRADSYLEAAFLRWVLAPACLPAIAERVTPQREVEVAGRRYRIDYEIAGSEEVVDVELDGYGFHGDRPAFTYDRLRQNDLASTGRILVHFSYDSIRLRRRDASPSYRQFCGWTGCSAACWCRIRSLSARTWSRIRCTPSSHRGGRP